MVASNSCRIIFANIYDISIYKEKENPVGVLNFHVFMALVLRAICFSGQFRDISIVKMLEIIYSLHSKSEKWLKYGIVCYNTYSVRYVIFALMVL